MFVHKPLCDKYRENSLLFFNKIYICRSCFYLYLGLLIGVIVGLNLNISFKQSVIFTGLIIFLSYPKFYRFFNRAVKDILRLLGGISVAILLITTFMLSIKTLLILICFLFLIKKYYNKLRGSRDLCKDCPEQYKSKSCAGYKLQTESILNIEEYFSNYIMRIQK